ncbi:MAG: hypothetical protein H0T89_11380 [Deltaproteobacteria bacterium]|nr:hypothetical protein [Deltaproteobacteria bacterium]
MAQKAGARVLFSVTFLTAAVGCGEGDETSNEPIDPNPLEIACTDAFKVTGSYTAGTPARPVDVEGCWPVGTWTFQLALDPTDDAILDVTGDSLPDRCGKVPGTTAATFESNYSFSVTRTDDGTGFQDSITMNGGAFQSKCANDDGSQTTGACLFRLKVSEGGGAECEGVLELYSADRKEYWNLHPEQTTGVASISGFGEFTRYNVAQKP